MSFPKEKASKKKDEKLHSIAKIANKPLKPSVQIRNDTPLFAQNVNEKISQ
jgi:hypothetical protein